MRTAAQTVVFDLGGVLIDWNPRYLYRDLFSDETQMEFFLRDVCSPAWNKQQDEGRSCRVATDELTSRHPEWASHIRAYYERFDDMMAGPIAGSVAILDDLHARGVPLYALSNWSAETWPAACDRFSFLGRFRGIVISGQEGVVKPDPRIYEILLSRYSLSPETSVFVDDVEENVVAAREQGIAATLFTDPASLRESLQSLGLNDFS